MPGLYRRGAAADGACHRVLLAADSLDPMSGRAGEEVDAQRLLPGLGPIVQRQSVR